MIKEVTLFSELDQLYSQAKKAKQFLDKYYVDGGDTVELRQILKQMINEDIDDLKLLNAALAHSQNKISAYEKKAISEIIKFMGLLYHEINSALIDLDRKKLSKISWFLQNIMGEIEEVHQAKRTPLELMSSDTHVKFVKILAGLENTRFKLNKLRTEAKAVYDRAVQRKIKFENPSYSLVKFLKNKLGIIIDPSLGLQVYLYLIYEYIEYLDSYLQETMRELLSHENLSQYTNGQNVAGKIMITYGSILDLLLLINAFNEYLEVKHYKNAVKILGIIKRKTNTILEKLLKLIDENSIEFIAYKIHTIKKYTEQKEYAEYRQNLFKMWLIHNHRLQNGRIIVLRM